MTSRRPKHRYWFKVLNKKRQGPTASKWFRQSFKYPRLGVWTPQLLGIELCRYGYHVTTMRGLPAWLHLTRSHDGEELRVFIAEVPTSGPWDYIGASGSYKAVFPTIRLVRELPWNSRLRLKYRYMQEKEALISLADYWGIKFTGLRAP